MDHGLNPTLSPHRLCDLGQVPALLSPSLLIGSLSVWVIREADTEMALDVTEVPWRRL